MKIAVSTGVLIILKIIIYIYVKLYEDMLNQLEKEIYNNEDIYYNDIS